jgi:hypothetical protein
MCRRRSKFGNNFRGGKKFGFVRRFHSSEAKNSERVNKLDRRRRRSGRAGRRMKRGRTKGRAGVSVRG